MGLPLKPSEVKEVVVLSTDTLCEAFKKTFIRFPIVFFTWYRWAYNADGSISDEYKKVICMACDIANPPTT